MQQVLPVADGCVSWRVSSLPALFVQGLSVQLSYFYDDVRVHVHAYVGVHVRVHAHARDDVRAHDMHNRGYAFL